MLRNQNKSTNKENLKYLIMFIFLSILFFGWLRFNDKWDRTKVWESEFSGIVTSFDVDKGRRGYYYYTNKNDVVIASYFFYDYNIRQQLNISDSIYKAPNSFKLYIYKTSEQGSYTFDRMEMKFKDLKFP